LSPTFVTRTSFPGRRNSFGRRTAWLRPCIKIFAVEVSGGPKHEDIYQ
jgi:hypothetical protein